MPTRIFQPFASQRGATGPTGATGPQGATGPSGLANPLPFEFITTGTHALATTNRSVFVNAGANTVILDLPADATGPVGTEFMVYVDYSSGSLTVNAAGGETILGNPTWVPRKGTYRLVKAIAGLWFWFSDGWTFPGSAGPLALVSFQGMNGAGSIMVNGVKLHAYLDDYAIVESAPSFGAPVSPGTFESELSVDGHIQQLSASDLSTKTYLAVLRGP